jgi:SAM-dependent methyltransferase
VASAAARWREDLATWAIPDEILAAAPESPWHFPVKLFASRADAVTSSEPTISNRRAQEALSSGGSVLDVGCGAGAASLALVPPAATLTGVDTSAGMLEAFVERAGAAGAETAAIEGAWPDVADRAPAADVVVCHHVFYNAPDLMTFAARLTDHACRRVVAELTVDHPLSNLNPLWLRFHGLVRPTRPTADDAVAVLREAGLSPERADWSAPRPGGFDSRAELVAMVRRLLCLTADRDPEIDEALGGRPLERDGRWGFPDRPVTTLWWDGTAEA